MGKAPDVWLFKRFVKGLGMKDEQVMVGSLGAESITEVAEPSWAGWSDWVGMIASIGCAVHCAAMPFVIAYLPALGLGFLADEGFHQWMAVGCFVIALLAFVPGLRKHRRLTPVIIGSVGLVMITTAAFGFAGECCASCQSDARTADSGAADLSGSAVSLASAEVCTEACCADAANKPAANQNVASKDVEAGVANDGAVAGPRVALAGVSLAALPTQSSAFSQLISRIVPWLTSIGGIVLVVAHLLNRRYGCLCGCCDADVSKVSS